MAEVNDLDGWDVPVEERLVSCTQVSELQCGICLDLLSDPCQCINGHLFCMTCILECIERKAECPQCRCQLSENSLSKSLFVRKYIDELLVHCRFYYMQPFEEITVSPPQTSVRSCSDEAGDSGPHSVAPPPLTPPLRDQSVKITVRKMTGTLPPLSGMAAAVLRPMSGMSQSCSDVRTALVAGRSSSSLRSSSSEIVAKKREGTTESSFQFDPRGCTEQLKHSDLHAHELHCGFAFIPCQYRELSSSGPVDHFVRRNEMEQHKTSCPWRPIPCSFCSALQPSHLVKEHEEDCDFRPVPCEQCCELVAKADTQAHLEDDCPESVMECPFSEEGCTAMMRRRQVEEHVATSMAKHLLLMQRRTAAQRQLIAQQEATISSLVAECKSLKQSVLLIPTDQREMTYVAKWEVERYSQKAILGFFQSPRFVFGGITWYMGVYPNPGNAASHVSLYLFVAKSDQPTAAVHVAYDFIIHNKNIAKSVRLKHICRFPLVSGDGWGSNEAIEKNLLTEEAGFLSDGCLEIQLEAKIRSIRVL